ncbi:hypothetical protein ACOME3_002827 [Neoechinorhynchus agilis]
MPRLSPARGPRFFKCKSNLVGHFCQWTKPVRTQQAQGWTCFRRFMMFSSRQESPKCRRTFRSSQQLSNVSSELIEMLYPGNRLSIISISRALIFSCFLV